MTPSLPPHEPDNGRTGNPAGWCERCRIDANAEARRHELWAMEAQGDNVRCEDAMNAAILERDALRELVAGQKLLLLRYRTGSGNVGPALDKIAHAEAILRALGEESR